MDTPLKIALVPFFRMIFGTIMGYPRRFDLGDLGWLVVTGTMVFLMGYSMVFLMGYSMGYHNQ